MDISPANVARVVDQYRTDLIAELAGIRAFEHRYQEYDDPYCVARAPQILAALAAIPVVDETEVAA